MLNALKYHLLIWSIISVLPITGFGQTKRFDIGGEIGTNVLFLWANQNGSKSEQPRFGFSTGIFFRYNFHENFSLETNPAFDGKLSYAPNTTIDEEPDPYLGTVDVASQYYYLTIPVRVRFSIGKKVRFFLSAGPYLSYMFKLGLLLRYSSGTEIGPLDYTGFFNQFEFGVSTGIGLGIPIKKFMVIHLEVRNNTGLNDIGNSKSAFGTSRRTTTIIPLIGATYTFGKRLKQK